MTEKDFVFSADGHVVEPTDLFRTRLPKHLRDRGFWEEDFEIEPLVEGGVRDFARVRTPGFEGWAVSRYRHFDGTAHTGDPDRMIEDMDLDGIDAQLMHPNRSLFALYSDDHELSIAHARVYNDYVVERYTPVLRTDRADRADPAHRHRRSRRRDRARRGRRLPRRSPARGFAAAVLVERPRAGVGRRLAPTGCTCSSTARRAE